MVELDRSAFLAIFRREAEEHLQKLDQGFLALEDHPEDRAPLEDIARAAHTLKGSARMLGLSAINEIAHCMEDVLVAAREDQIPLEGPLFDLLFEAPDCIRALLEPESEGSMEVHSLCERLGQASRGDPFETQRPMRTGATDVCGSR